MKSIDHRALACIGASSVCRSRIGRRFFVRRGRLSLSWQYTRQTRLWFQRWPSSRRRRKHFQKPHRPCRATSPCNASMTSASFVIVSVTGLYHEAFARPLARHARCTDKPCSTTRACASSCRSSGPSAFLRSHPSRHESPAPARHTNA